MNPILNPIAIKLSRNNLVPMSLTSWHSEEDQIRQSERKVSIPSVHDR